MYCPGASPIRCQWIGYRARGRVWPTRLKSTATTTTLDKHLAPAHRHHVPAVEGLFRVGRCLKLDIACDHADFTTLIHVEGNLAEVHVVQFLVQRDRISADGGNGSPLCLPGVEIRG